MSHLLAPVPFRMSPIPRPLATYTYFRDRESGDEIFWKPNHVALALREAGSRQRPSDKSRENESE